ncbi:unnamed protein product [Phytophthora fragariaefolia]|uniref:Unnamed protein product n=1 Tax=Phytophthora fragariaefolia TaxID=1490495 RepID=A0A9W6XLV6_9STRA|nr:unnamed protein product [Phytophthora fragariaefolia]
MAQNCWQQLQIGHRQRYSVERMLALRDYCENTSLLRVLFVCLATPLPAFAAVVLIECIPLTSPAEGWRANYAFWIRLFLSSFPMAVGGALQVKQVIPPGIISYKATVAIGIATATGYVSCALALAVLWTFPVPFGYALMVGPFVTFFMASFCVAVRRKVCSKDVRHQITPQLSVLAAQGVLAGCYPAFYAVFRQLTGLQQTAFVLVLPMIKLLSKQYIAKVCSHLHEYIGPTIIFSVDVCNVLYSVICMQTAVSSLTTIFMFTSDAFHIVLALRAIYFQINSGGGSSIRARRMNFLQTLPVIVRKAFQSVEVLDDDPSKSIRIWAPFSLPLGADSNQLMTELSFATVVMIAPPTVASPASSMRRGSSLPNIRYPTSDSAVDSDQKQKVDAEVRLHHTMFQNGLKVKSLPALRPVKVRIASRSLSVTAISTKGVTPSLILNPLRIKTAVEEARDALQALFHAEYVIMAEYVEGALPMLYTVYLAVLCHLPMAAYYPHMRSLVGDKLYSTLGNLVLYGLVEVASLVGVSLLLKRKFGFSPLYQLAFVLETQARALQSQLFIWVLCIVQLTLVHNGECKARTFWME